MRVGHCSVYVRERSELREQSFVRESGEPWAWLELGEDNDVSLYGTPTAMRRLGAAVTAAADAADELTRDQGRLDGAAPAAA